MALDDYLSKLRGGGLHARKEGVSIIDAPILIVGLGGTGCSAVAEIKRMVNERFSDRKGKIGNLAFLAIDTAKETAGEAFGFTKEEVLIVAARDFKETYQATVHQGKHPHIAEWIEGNLHPEHVVDGAGQVRQLGRLALFSDINRIRDGIKDSVIKVRGKSERQSYYVFICSGISGGTGSGMFLDIPYIIKDIIQSETKFDSRILGFLFLPDVNFSNDTTESSKNSLMSNGFAALKELNYLMNLSQNGDVLTPDYDGRGNNKISSEAPYNFCNLISKTNARGVLFRTNNDCYKVTAETILNFIAKEDVVKDKDGQINTTLSLEEFLTNVRKQEDSYKATLGNLFNPLLYTYCIAGSSTAMLPIDDLFSYLTAMMFDQMRDMWNRVPTPDDVTHFIKDNGLELDAIVGVDQLFKNSSPFSLNADYLDLDIEEVPRRVGEDCVEKYEPIRQLIANNKSICLLDVEEKVSNELAAVFKDIRKGPFYANDLIFQSDQNAITVYKEIEKIIKECRDNKPTAADLRELENKIRTQSERLIHNPPLFIFRRSAVQEFIALSKRYYLAKIDADKYDAAIEIYNNILVLLSKKNHTIFTFFVKLLNDLRQIFNKNREIVTTETELTQNEDGGQRFYWNIIDSNDVIKTVHIMLSDPEYSSYRPDYNAMITHLLDKMFDNYGAEWINNGDKVRAQMLEMFINDEFDNLLGRLSVEEIIRFAAKNNDEAREKKIDDIITDLNSNSEVWFDTKDPIITNPAATYEYYSVPSGATGIEAKIQKSDKCTVKKSKLTNRVFKMKVCVAIPLSIYQRLSDCEKAYNMALSRSAGDGIHLYGGGINGTKYNWRDLPSPLSPTVWETTYKCQRTIDYYAHWSLVFNNALEKGYVAQENINDPTSGFICFYGKVKSVKDFLLEQGVKDGDEKNISYVAPERAKIALQALTKEINNASRKAESKRLFENKGGDKNFAAYIFGDMPVIAEQIEEMLRNLSDYERIKILFEEVAKANDLYYDYLNLFYFTKKISRDQRNNYIYQVRSGETKRFCALDLGKPSEAKEVNAYRDFYQADLYKEFFQTSANKGVVTYLVGEAEKYRNGEDFAVDKYYEQLSKLKERFQTILDTLNEDYENSIFDKDRKLSFYTEVFGIVDGALSEQEVSDDI